jgi:hypothetical protein
VIFGLISGFSYQRRARSSVWTLDRQDDESNDCHRQAICHADRGSPTEIRIGWGSNNKANKKYVPSDSIEIEKFLK